MINEYINKILSRKIPSRELIINLIDKMEMFEDKTINVKVAFNDFNYNYDIIIDQEVKNMGKKDKNSVIIYSIVAGIIVLIVGILDYNDTLGFISVKLNFEFLNIFINALVIIFMFIITYLLIESKTISHEEIIVNNKKEFLILLLEKVCDECLSQIEILNDQEMIEKYLIPKIDFNATNDSIIKNIKIKPFEYGSEIINLFSDGIIDKKYFSNYMKIKDCFERYIQWRIILFDVKKVGRRDLELLAETKKMKY